MTPAQRKAKRQRALANIKADPQRYAAYRTYFRAYRQQWEQQRERVWVWSLDHWDWRRIRRPKWETLVPLPRVDEIPPLLAVLLLCVFLCMPTLSYADHYDGTLEYVVTADEQPHAQWYLLLPHGERLALAGAIDGWTGKAVTVHGKRTGQSLLVHALLNTDGSPSSANDLPPEPLPDENLGALRAIVLFVEFADTPDSASLSSIRSATEGIVEPYYTEVSDGKTDLAVDYAGKFSLPIPHTCSLSTLLTAAIKTADPVIDFTQYQFIALVSKTSCGYGGIALVGRTNIVTADGSIRAGYSNTVSTRSDLGKVMVHELGHNFRSHHSGFLNCLGMTVRPALYGCVRSEYGNPYSVMGSVAAVGHFDAPQKAFLRFWDEGLDFVTVTAPGRYTIAPHDVNGSGLRGLRIPRGAGNNYYWIEARNEPFLGGALLTIPDTIGSSAYAAAKPLLLDTSPATASPSSSALLPGETFVSAVTGTRITTMTRDSTSLTVDVSPGTPDLTVPLVAFLSPPARSTVAGSLRVEVTAFDEHLAVIELYSSRAPTQKFRCTISPCVWMLDTTTLSNGSYLLYADALDGVGNRAQTTVIIDVKNEAPPPPPPPPDPPTFCGITSPRNGALVPRRSFVTVAVETDGQKMRLADNGVLVCADTTSPFSCQLSTGNGKKTHTLIAYCSNTGSTDIQSQTVTVRNQP